jgi:UDP-glucose 4-epimerase
MKVLITGGAGYIGYSLVEALEANEQVTSILVYDNLHQLKPHFFLSGSKMPKTRFIKGDILDQFELQKALKDVDIVIHLAAYVTLPYSHYDNFKYEQTNQYGCGVLYNLLKEQPPKRLIYMSSAAVYGFSKDSSETSIPEPTNAYGVSKYQGEKYLQLLSGQSEVYTLRCANIYGCNPVVRLDTVVNNFIFESLLYNKIKIHGNGNQMRPFIGLKTVVAEVEKMVTGQYKQPGIYNLVENNLSLNDIRDILIGLKPNLEFTYLATATEMPSLTMRTDKLKLEADALNSISSCYNEFKNQFRL